MCDELSSLVGASGGMLVPFDMDGRALAMPHSKALGGLVESYFRDGWNERDSRGQGFMKMLTTGSVTDQDILTVEQIRGDPFYAEWLAPAGLGWFVGVGFMAGSKWWSAVVHGSIERGAFVSGDVEKLAALRGYLSLAAKRSMAMGQRRVESMEAAFSTANRGVAALGWTGKIAWQNARAEQFLRDGDLVAAGRIRSSDPEIDRKLSNLIEHAVAFQTRPDLNLPGPVLVPAGPGRRLSIDAIPMPRDFLALVGNACVLVTLHEVGAEPSLTLHDLASRFRLTQREMQLSAKLLTGCNLSRAAGTMDISVATARQYVKSVFAKTGTHSQAELVALLARAAS